MRRRLDLRMLGRGLLVFWAVYFGIVTLSNLSDLCRSLHLLPADWRWVSGNLAFIRASTGSLPPWTSQLLLAGVIAWQALSALLFWRAARNPAGRWLGPAFVVSVALWAAFVLLDELLLIFETGAEATHLRLMIAELLTLVLLRPGGLLGATEGSPPMRG